jgi:hypothetical protein
MSLVDQARLRNPLVLVWADISTQKTFALLLVRVTHVT